MVSEMSKKLGHAETPEVLLIDRKTVAKMSLPFGLRWIMNQPKVGNAIMEKTFAAVAASNIFITTQAALDKMTGDKLRFTAAQEMSHIQKDALSLPPYVSALTKYMTKALWMCTVATVALGFAGVAVPTFTGSLLLAAGGLIATQLAAKVVNNYGMRVLENRADRNAMYIMRDFEAGKAALEQLHEKKTELAKRGGPLKEMFLIHPSQVRRIENLKKSFDKASQYPVFLPPSAATANDNKAQAAPDAAKKPQWTTLESLRQPVKVTRILDR
jgi:Zn-dependent protease with chaperone function